MFAIIETGGKQYRVSEGDKLKIEKLEKVVGDTVAFDKVLLKHDGDKTEVGQPFLSKVSVEAKVLDQARAKKVIVFKYHSKTREKKKKGHRQTFTEVLISKIN